MFFRVSFRVKFLVVMGDIKDIVDFFSRGSSVLLVYRVFKVGDIGGGFGVRLFTLIVSFVFYYRVSVVF